MDIELLSKGRRPLFGNGAYMLTGRREWANLRNAVDVFVLHGYHKRFEEGLGAFSVKEIRNLISLLDERAGNTILVLGVPAKNGIERIKERGTRDDLGDALVVLQL